jgi:hypothetical protein
MKIKLFEKILEKTNTLREGLPEGVLCRVSYPVMRVGVKNANKRVYGTDVAEAILNDPTIQEKLKTRTLFGNMEHPTDSALKLSKDETSHIISKIYLDEAKGILYQDIDVLPTEAGKFIDVLLGAGCQVGVSTRAEGELQEAIEESGEKYFKVVAESYCYISTDFTADPSTPDALPENLQRQVMSITKQKYEAKQISKQTAVALLERVSGKEAKTLSESIQNEGKSDISRFVSTASTEQLKTTVQKAEELGLLPISTKAVAEDHKEISNKLKELASQGYSHLAWVVVPVDIVKGTNSIQFFGLQTPPKFSWKEATKVDLDNWIVYLTKIGKSEEAAELRKQIKFLSERKTKLIEGKVIKTFTFEVEENKEYIPCKAKVEVIYNKDNSYGADADGNRGVPVTFIEDFKILSLEKDGVSISPNQVPKNIEDAIASLVDEADLTEAKLKEAVGDDEAIELYSDEYVNLILKELENKNNFNSSVALDVAKNVTKDIGDDPEEINLQYVEELLDEKVEKGIFSKTENGIYSWNEGKKSVKKEPKPVQKSTEGLAAPETINYNGMVIRIVQEATRNFRVNVGTDAASIERGTSFLVGFYGNAIRKFDELGNKVGQASKEEVIEKAKKWIDLFVNGSQNELQAAYDSAIEKSFIKKMAELRKIKLTLATNKKKFVFLMDNDKLVTKEGTLADLPKWIAELGEDNIQQVEDEDLNIIWPKDQKPVTELSDADLKTEYEALKAKKTVNKAERLRQNALLDELDNRNIVVESKLIEKVTPYFENLGEVNKYLEKIYGASFDLPAVDYGKSVTVRQNNAHVQIYRMDSGKYEVVDYKSKTDESKLEKIFNSLLENKEGLILAKLDWSKNAKNLAYRIFVPEETKLLLSENNFYRLFEKMLIKENEMTNQDRLDELFYGIIQDNWVKVRKLKNRNELGAWIRKNGEKVSNEVLDSLWYYVSQKDVTESKFKLKESLEELQANAEAFFANLNKKPTKADLADFMAQALVSKKGMKYEEAFEMAEKELNKLKESTVLGVDLGSKVDVKKTEVKELEPKEELAVKVTELTKQIEELMKKIEDIQLVDKKKNERIASLEEAYAEDVLRLTKEKVEETKKLKLNFFTKKELEEAKTTIVVLKELVNENKQTIKTLTEAKVNESKKVSLTETKVTSLVEKHTKEINALKEAHTLELVRKYGKTLLEARGLKLPKHLQTLFEACSTEAEVRQFLREAVNQIREGILESTPLKEVVVTKEVDEKTEKLKSSIATAFVAMR